MSKRVSIYDVALEAGVSPASVSYAINGKGKVSEKTRKRILEVMNRMGYTPDTSAVSLSTGKSYLVGICLPYKDVSDAFIGNPFYSEFIGAFQKELSSHGYDSIIGSLRGKKSFERWMKSRKLDGFVFFGLYSEDIISLVRKANLPAVMVDSYARGLSGFTTVTTDDFKGAMMATDYLFDLGHEKIAFVGGSARSPLNQKRFEGYERSFSYHGKKCDLSLVYRTKTTLEGGEEAANFIIEHLNDLTAVVCDADIIAIGLIRKLHECGISVPQKVSVVSFDDISSAKYIYPALTTVHQNISEKGRVSALELLKRLSKSTIEPNSVVLDPKLVIRDSTRPLNETPYKKFS